MNSVINVTQNVVGNKTIDTVNARSLHEFLGVGKHFSNWIKDRIEKYDFVEFTDYTKVQTLCGKRSNVRKIDYEISLDAAEKITEHENLKINLRRFVLKEPTALTTIEQILGISLKRQHHVLGYFIDGYDEKNNIAYEVDEEYHDKQEEQDTLRMNIIKEALGCTFVRIRV